MNIHGIWFGLFAFVVGIVLWANFQYIVPYQYNYNTQSGPSGLQVLANIVVEFIVAILIFGGLLMILLNWDWKPTMPASASAPAPKPKSTKTSTVD